MEFSGNCWKSDMIAGNQCINIFTDFPRSCFQKKTRTNHSEKITFNILQFGCKTKQTVFFLAFSFLFSVFMRWLIFASKKDRLTARRRSTPARVVFRSNVSHARRGSPGNASASALSELARSESAAGRHISVSTAPKKKEEPPAITGCKVMS